MGIRVLEIHHHAVRIDAEPPKLEAVQKFYQDVLGLEADPGRPTIPGVPGFWINVGEGGQVHLIGGAQPSPLGKGQGQYPASAARNTNGASRSSKREACHITGTVPICKHFMHAARWLPFCV